MTLNNKRAIHIILFQSMDKHSIIFCSDSFINTFSEQRFRILCNIIFNTNIEFSPVIIINFDLIIIDISILHSMNIKEVIIFSFREVKVFFTFIDEHLIFINNISLHSTNKETTISCKCSKTTIFCCFSFRFIHSRNITCRKNNFRIHIC